MAALRLWPDLLPRRVWKIILWVSSTVLIGSLIFLAFVYLIMPGLQGIKNIGPIILMGIGVFLFVIFFGAGTVWFYIQLQQSICSSQDDPLSPENIIKTQARLHLLKRDQSELAKLMEQYENTAPKRFTRYLDHSYLNKTSNIDSFYLDITIKIKSIAQNDFKEDIDPWSINTKKYDPHMPFPEDGQITDDKMRHNYRKAKYEYLSNKETIDNLMARFKNEIERNERLITEYARKNIQPQK